MRVFFLTHTVHFACQPCIDEELPNWYPHKFVLHGSDPRIKNLTLDSITCIQGFFQLFLPINPNYKLGTFTAPRGFQLKNVNDLEPDILDFHANVPHFQLQKLENSISARTFDAILKNGGATRFQFNTGCPANRVTHQHSATALFVR